MTIAEIMEQAKTLSHQERKELVKLLVDSLDVPASEPDTTVHWGQQLIELLNTLDLSAWDSDDDVVTLLRRQREEQAQRYQSTWDEPE
jgi:hypothetical protein